MDTFINKDIFARDYSERKRTTGDVMSRDEALQELKHVVEGRITIDSGEKVDSDLYGRGKKRVLFLHPQSPRAIRRSLTHIESDKDSGRTLRGPHSSSFARLFKVARGSSATEAWSSANS